VRVCVCVKMRWCWFWPLFIFTLLIMFLVSIIHRDTTPGAIYQCDRKHDCGAKRFFMYDNSWLCCEDAGGWTAAHIFHPLGLTVLIGWPEFVLFFVFYYEALEADATSLFNTFVFVPSDPTTRETLPGSVIADAQIQGVLGVLLGISLMAYFNWHGFLYNHWPDMRWGVRAKYLLVIILYSAAFPLIDISGKDGDVCWGLLMLNVYHVILILFLIPLFIRDNDVPGYDVRLFYSRFKWLWATCEFLIGLMNVLPRFLPNYYYQTWFVTVGLILIFQLWLSVRFYGNKSKNRPTNTSPIQINN